MKNNLVFFCKFYKLTILSLTKEKKKIRKLGKEFNIFKFSYCRKINDRMKGERKKLYRKIHREAGPDKYRTKENIKKRQRQL